MPWMCQHCGAMGRGRRFAITIPWNDAVEKQARRAADMEGEWAQPKKFLSGDGSHVVTLLMCGTCASALSKSVGHSSASSSSDAPGLAAASGEGDDDEDADLQAALAEDAELQAALAASLDESSTPAQLKAEMQLEADLQAAMAASLAEASSRAKEPEPEPHEEIEPLREWQPSGGGVAEPASEPASESWACQGWHQRPPHIPPPPTRPPPRPLPPPPPRPPSPTQAFNIDASGLDVVVEEAAPPLEEATSSHVAESEEAEVVVQLEEIVQEDFDEENHWVNFR